MEADDDLAARQEQQKKETAVGSSTYKPMTTGNQGISVGAAKKPAGKGPMPTQNAGEDPGAYAARVRKWREGDSDSGQAEGVKSMLGEKK